MNKHAYAILEAAEAWNWPAPSCMDTLGANTDKASEFKIVCRRLLLCLIAESHRLGGTLLERFWGEIEKSHPQFMENVQELKHTPYYSYDDTVQTFYENVDTDIVDFNPVFELAADLFTHIGLPFMNYDDDRFWRLFSPLSTLSPNTPRQKSFENRGENLKILALKRDGTSCPFSEVPYYGLGGVDPTLTYIIPCSIKSKAETLDYISVIAGNEAMESVLQYSNTIDNVFTVEASVTASHRRNCWGLEARENPNDIDQVTYYFKTFETGNMHRAGSVLLRDGDEITFGQGPEGAQYRNGPHPILCNLRLAVSRALHTSGAAEFISQLMHDAGDFDCRRITIKDHHFHEVLSAKLLICGRAQIA
ncbi:hypothetical protein E4T56_gene299 [Termitomyces sp. T112]|nr:hypothetical protein C0989_006478 [Termitomyces sp. Mn162]KAG5723176.1 hypothetical protein E4T56_gene299 [Termitomyces sp. T112]KAH0585580.1 hypothetical protein H2248_008810 [Termitomyces sp. 'cryptogamus']